MRFMEKKLSGKSTYHGVVIDVRVDDVELINGRTSRREVVEHCGGVTILPVDTDGCAYMVRQYRYPVGRELLEAPAGKMEPGEKPLACAIRELREETGFTAEKLIDMHPEYPSPGFCEEILYMYLATGLTPGVQQLDADEFLGVEKWPLDKLTDMIMKGEIIDGKTIIAVFKARELLKDGGAALGK